MTIEAQLPGGTTLQFPDGTPDAVVQGAVKQHLSQQPDDGSSQTPESKLGLTPAPPEPSKQARPWTQTLGAAAETITSPEASAAAQPPATLPSLTEIRSGIQNVDKAAQDYLKPSPNTGPLEWGVKAAGSLGVHLASNAIQIPLNILMGLTQEGPQIDPNTGRFSVPGATIDPGTGRLGLTPEAEAAGQIGAVPFRSGEIFSRPAPSAPPPAAEAPPPPPPAPAPSGPQSPSFVPPGARQGPTLGRINELIQADIDQAARRPAEIPPTTTKDPVTGEVKPIQQPPNPADRAQAPQPTAGETSPPAGAQITPSAQAGLTPEQVAAAGSTADKLWYYKTIIPGEADTTQYIKGINPTMAQRELTVNAARESKNLRRLSEEADQNERELLAEHTAIRKGEFQDIAGSDVTQQTDMKAASDQIERDLQAAYAHGGTVDLQPVIAAAQAELTGSAGKLPPVRAAMKAVMDAAQKDDGTGLETDPRQANAVRRAIIYMQSKEGRLENPGYGSPDTMAALTRVKDVLTKQVEPAAPGFTKANSDYAAARQAADVREALQAYEPKLYQGPLGNMTFAPFHRLMGEVIAGRDPRAPMNPYKAMTEEQFNRLKSLHDDLQRVASAQELANAAGGGSDTGQTLFDMAKKAARTGISTAGGAGTGFVVGHLFGHEAGMAAGMFTQRALDNLFSQRAVAQATAEHNRLLRPDLTQYPLKPNQLMNPPPP